MKFTCPCCGHMTLPEQPPGTDEICPVCYWHDDRIQFLDPHYEGGANDESLREAQQNFLEFGAFSARFRGNVRAPRSDEPRDPQWKPVGA